LYLLQVVDELLDEGPPPVAPQLLHHLVRMPDHTSINQCQWVSPLVLTPCCLFVFKRVGRACARMKPWSSTLHHHSLHQ
jgi:hypothetical protein